MPPTIFLGRVYRHSIADLLRLAGIAATALSALIFLGPNWTVHYTWVHRTEESAVARREWHRSVYIGVDRSEFSEHSRTSVKSPDGLLVPFSRLGGVHKVPLFALNCAWLKFVVLGSVVCWPIGIHLQARIKRRGFEVHPGSLRGSSCLPL
ncbi:hypothetical protein [Humisphaera borealis]|uniref:Uncharacterized protein n=1 Tax=Humisphaera borealis TaxID=2807512 RepID=A0A7M2WTI8_9BACT|nr:hypothetical protein [Humisphaera borealis]QOV88574.1 hypothetical protein IPV69_20360 [Humisphaera borealis]